jgi:hypothetical protein
LVSTFSNLFVVQEFVISLVNFVTPSIFCYLNCFKQVQYFASQRFNALVLKAASVLESLRGSLGLTVEVSVVIFTTPLILYIYIYIYIYIYMYI